MAPTDAALGQAVGIAIGLLGGRLMLFAQDRGLTADPYEGVGALLLASTIVGTEKSEQEQAVSDFLNSAIQESIALLPT